MIKSKEEILSRGLELDTTGPDGNAFVVLGMAGSLAKELGLDKSEIQNEMTAGDYEHLIDVFEKHFGDYVTIYR